jgi:hypothetical protein
VGLVGFVPEDGLVEADGLPGEVGDRDVGDWLAGVDPPHAVQVGLRPVRGGGAVASGVVEGRLADDLVVDDGAGVVVEQVGGSPDLLACDVADHDALLRAPPEGGVVGEGEHGVEPFVDGGADCG